MDKKKVMFDRLIVVLFFISIVFGYSAGQSNGMQYEIWVELDVENKMLRANQSLEWTNYSNDNIDEMHFHLYWNAFKNEESAFLQEGLEKTSFGKRSGLLEDPEDAGWIDIKSVRVAHGADLTDSIRFITSDIPQRPGDQTVMKLLLDEPLLPGESISLELEFESKIPRTIARSGYYQESYFIGQWFPKPGVYEQGKGWNCHQYHMHTEFFADYAEFMVHITVPINFVIGASGRLISEITRELDQTTTYTYWQDRIHDFAWAADPKFIKLEKLFIADSLILESEYEKYAEIFNVSPDEIKLPDVNMVLLIRKEHEGQADRHFTALEQALKYYGLWFGSYAYETITIIDPPYRTKSEGMEYPTLFTTQTSLIISEYGRTPERVIMHEFGHQYWYGMVGNNEFEEAWIDEGMTTYSEGRVQDKLYGKSHGIPRFFGLPFTRYFRDIRFYSWEFERTMAIMATEMDHLVTHSWRFYHDASYGLNVYYRASTLLLTLERILGEEIMLRTMRRFQMEYRYKHPTISDFIKTVNEVSGRDMSWFFEEFFFEANNFDYGIGDVFTKKIHPSRGVFDTDSGKVNIDYEQDGETADSINQYLNIVKARRFGEAKLGGDELLHIQITLEDSTVLDHYWDGQERWTDFRFITNSPIKLIHADPRNKYLIDSNFSNNSFRVKSEIDGVRRWTSKIMFWLQNLMQMATIFS